MGRHRPGPRQLSLYHTGRHPSAQRSRSLRELYLHLHGVSAEDVAAILAGRGPVIGCARPRSLALRVPRPGYPVLTLAHVMYTRAVFRSVALSNWKE